MIAFVRDCTYHSTSSSTEFINQTFCPRQSRFLEAPFVHMLRMRSASLKKLNLSDRLCYFLVADHHQAPPLPPRAPKRPKSCASGSTLAPAGSSLLPLSSGRNTPGSSLNTSTISLRPLSALSQNRSTIRSEADATGTDCDFLLQKLVDERYSCNKILLRPKIKFPVQIEMAFSQIR